MKDNFYKIKLQMRQTNADQLFETFMKIKLFIKMQRYDENTTINFCNNCNTLLT